MTFIISRCGKGLLMACLATLLPGAVSAQTRDIPKLYQENCSGCHGANLEGGQTDSMLDDTWKHGADDQNLARVIRDGAESEGMPPWKGQLSEAEIRGMVVFIREKGEQARTKATTFNKPALDEVTATQEHKFRLRNVADDLDSPWSVAFLPQNKLLITEQRGTLRIFENGSLRAAAIIGTPKVRYKGQGGLMDVAPHPGYLTNGWIYLAFTDPGSNQETSDAGMTAVVRGRIKNYAWTDEQTIFRAPMWSYRGGGVHFGCRLVFDQSGHLFFPIGERGQMQDAQDITRPNGKVHRVFDDGRIPPDNPFVGRSNAIPSIWSFGHRNPQGLDFHPVTRTLWDAEHGPRGGDELNLVLKGRNYGWPIITHGMNYNGTPITAFTHKEGLEQPVVHWTPSIAVCSIAFYSGDKFPRWKNNLFVTALAKEELRRLVIEGEKVISQEVIFRGIGRVRDVAAGPDGYLYVVLNKPDKVVRMEPAD